MAMLVRSSRTAFAAALLSFLAGFLTACSNGGSGSASLTALSVSAAQTIDAGQTTTVYAYIYNDTANGGAKFSVTGGGTLGAPSATTKNGVETVAVTYTASAAAGNATITATSVANPAQSYTIAITIDAAPQITTTSLPAATVNTAYNVTLQLTGGTGNYTWAIASGSLPAGLTLNAGTISGTPTAAGTSTFTVSATDQSQVPFTAVATYNLTVAPAVTTTSLPNGVIGTGYSQQLAYAGGGTGTWAITAGSLPTSSGLTLSASGLISGTPTTAATYSFSVAVTVGTQASASQALTLTVVAPPVVTTTSLPSGHLNVAYSQQLMYTGGSGTATWAITAGSLPASSGLTLSTSGLISGKAAAVGTYSFSVAVTVGTLTSASQPLSITIYSTQITSASTATGEVGVPFAFQVTAIGGTAPYTFSVASGSSLPPGLTIGSSTGLISGTPTSNSGSPYTTTIQASDSLGSTTTQAMTITINASRGAAGNADLSGQYAFVLTGFDASGNPLAEGGVFTADGAGHITAGALDTNSTAAAPTSNAALSASAYNVGADGRGVVTLTTASGSTTYVLSLNTLSSGTAQSGAMTEFDATGRQLSGQIYKQTTAAFTTTAVAGGFAFGVMGNAANSAAGGLTRSATVGEMQLSSTGTVSSSELVSTASVTPVVPTAGTLTIGTNGRGSLSLVESGGTYSYDVYVVSARQLLLLSSDAATGTTGTVHDLVAGQALGQTIANGSFTAANVLGAGVFAQSAVYTLGASQISDVQVGTLSFDGAGNITGNEDRNQGGTPSQSALAGTYTMATDGRVTSYVGAYGLGGCSDCTKPEYIFYLAGPGSGFFIDFATGGGAGILVPQTTATFTSASFSGTYSFGTDGTLVAATVPESGALTPVSTGTMTGTVDQGASLALVPDVAVTDSISVASSGRVAVTSGSSAVAAIYLTSSSRGLWIDLTSAMPAVREVDSH